MRSATAAKVRSLPRWGYALSVHVAWHGCTLTVLLRTIHMLPQALTLWKSAVASKREVSATTAVRTEKLKLCVALMVRGWRGVVARSRSKASMASLVARFRDLRRDQCMRNALQVGAWGCVLCVMCVCVCVFSLCSLC